MRRSVNTTARLKRTHQNGLTRRNGQSGHGANQDRQQYLTLRAAARRAGLSLTTMYQWVKRGHTSSGVPILVVKDDLKNQFLISKDDLAAMLANRYTLLAPEADAG